jgi:hypothetical protein
MTEGAAIWQVLSALGLGALVGGVGGAFATHLLSEHREKERNESDRDGLLRLVQAEIARNSVASEMFETHPTVVAEGRFPSAVTDVWEDVRVRLAQLLPEEDFETLSGYYAKVTSFLVLLRAFREVRVGDEEEGTRWSSATLAQLGAH